MSDWLGANRVVAAKILCIHAYSSDLSLQKANLDNHSCGCRRHSPKVEGTVDSYHSSFLLIHNARSSAQSPMYTQPFSQLSATNHSWNSTCGIKILSTYEANNSLTFAMSNYPTPSTFGTLFNPNGHLEPTVGSCDHGLLPPSQYPYQNSSSLHSPNAMPIVPHTNSNTQSFSSNAQGVATPNFDQEVNGTPYAFYGGPIQQSVFQSSAYSPTSFAHGAPSSGARPFSQYSTISNHHLKSSTVFPNIRHATEAQSTKSEHSDTVPPALSELEDGELDDGEVEKATGSSRASTMTPSGVSRHKRHENSDFARSESSHRVTHTPNKPIPGLIQGKSLRLSVLDMSKIDF